MYIKDVLFLKITTDALPRLPVSFVCGRNKSADNKMASLALKFTTQCVRDLDVNKINFGSHFLGSFFIKNLSLKIMKPACAHCCYFKCDGFCSSNGILLKLILSLLE